MLNGKKIIVVMPAYNAALTLARTLDEVPRDIVDEILLVDDASSDGTATLANELGLRVYLHNSNFGYGRNQKTCYAEALKHGADIVVMLHPDYQYSPRLIVPIASMIAYGEYDVAIASRILGKGAIKGGMPRYKYWANRFLTLFQNILMGQKLSEYHTGFRAFRREVLETLPLAENSDDFVFDNQMLSQIMYFRYRLGEISCPTRYFPEASSIGFARGIRYGTGVVLESLRYRAAKLGLLRPRIFSSEGAAIVSSYYKEVSAASDLTAETKAAERR